MGDASAASAARRIGGSQAGRPARWMSVSLPPFQRLVDDHWRDVARLAHALAGPVDGDDVAQQAWTQAYVAYPSLRSVSNLRGWLLTITHRCAMDAHRARARRAVPTDDDAVLERAGTVDSPEHGVVDEALWRRVSRLPERQRVAVVLKYVGDLDHPAIAQLLGITPTTSRRLVSDGLKALRESA